MSGASCATAAPGSPSEVAGDPLIHFVGRGNETQVLTFPDQPFASYFSGNTVQICPVGALTAKPYRFKARPWDLEQDETTCTTCSVGCRVTVQSSRNRVLRYQGVDIDPVNWGWLCDKGRFGFEAIEQRGNGWPRRWFARATSSSRRRGRRRSSAPRSRFARRWPRAGPTSVAVIGGARLTNEDATRGRSSRRASSAPTTSTRSSATALPRSSCSASPRRRSTRRAGPARVLVLGPDLKEELPVLYLRLRDAVEKRGLRVVELSPTATSTTPLAAASPPVPAR